MGSPSPHDLLWPDSSPQSKEPVRSGNGFGIPRTYKVKNVPYCLTVRSGNGFGIPRTYKVKNVPYCLTNLYGYVLNNPVILVDPLGLINWSAVGKGAVSAFGGGVAVVGGALASTTGLGAIGGVPAVFGGSAAFGWGISQVITGFADSEIPFMGVKEAVIKNTTDPGLLQDELLGINTLGDMLPTGRTAPTALGKVNSILQSGQSISNSGLTIMKAMDGGDTDSSLCK